MCLYTSPTRNLTYVPCYLNITQTPRHDNILHFTQTLYRITPLLHNLTSQPILTYPYHYFTTTHLTITSINYTWPHLNCTLTSHSFSRLYNTLAVLGGTLHHATIHIFPIAIVCSFLHISLLHKALLYCTLTPRHKTNSASPDYTLTPRDSTVLNPDKAPQNYAEPWQNIQDKAPHDSTAPLPNYKIHLCSILDLPTTLHSIPYQTIPLLLCSKHYKSPPLLLRTARNLILPYFTQTEQYHTQLYLDGTRQNNTPHYNTITSLCLFQLTITLQYHKLLFSTITNK